MTTAQRREEILALLNQADAPIAAKDLAARFGVSRQVIVQDLAVIRASRPNIISTNRGYILQQQETGCLREFKVRHTPEQAGQELNLIVDHGGRVKNISISHRVYGRITAEMDIRSRQDVQEFLQALAGGASTVLSTATDGYHYHLVEAATPDRLDLIGQALQDAGFPGPPAAVGKRKVSKIEKRPFELLGSNGRFILGFFRCKGCVVRHRRVQHRLSGPQPGSGKFGRSRPAWPW